MRGKGFEADLMGQRFKNLTRRLQFKQERRVLETGLFRPPEGDQLGFNFDVSAA